MGILRSLVQLRLEGGVFYRLNNHKISTTILTSSPGTSMTQSRQILFSLWFGPRAAHDLLSGDEQVNLMHRPAHRLQGGDE